MRQQRWVELLNDYECEIRYHPSKANVVVDAESRKERAKPRRVKALTLTIQSRLSAQIREAQLEALREENKAEEAYEVWRNNSSSWKMEPYVSWTEVWYQNLATSGA